MINPDGHQLSEPPLVELLATLSHEFRTPLSVIKGYTSMLLRQKQRLTSEEQDEFFQMIHEAGNRLEILTERLFELAQLEAGTFQLQYGQVDMLSLAQETITDAKRRVPEPLRDRFTFHLQCRDVAGNQAEELPPVNGDAHCLHKVLDHLLENAIRYSPMGGRIDVIARPAPQDGTTTMHDQSGNAPPFLEICVCDFGLGIPDGHQERIFEHFYRIDTRLNREVSGLGLGLTVCKYLVAMHHGRIWVESCPAGGSAFHIWLPLEQPSMI